jgi:hypothetical protein
MTPIMGNTVFKIGRADDPAECAAESAARSLESPTEPSPWPIKTSLSAPPPVLRPLPALASDAAVLRRQAAPGATLVSPELLNRPSKGYVDDFENVVYDVDYRGVPRGSLSKWLQVHYRDGTKIDINIDSIIDKSVGPEESEDLKRSGRIGEGGRIFPSELNSGTTPRLAAAKRQALIVMDDYNALFILGTFPVVWLIITTAGVPPLGELPPATRRPISRIPAEPETTAAPAATLGIRERLIRYYQRLSAKPAARTADEGLRQVSDTLDEVEDQFSGVPKRNPPPPPGENDGRMYPPLSDNITRQADGSIIARTRGHRINIGSDGSITITNIKTGGVEFKKP